MKNWNEMNASERQNYVLEHDSDMETHIRAISLANIRKGLIGPSPGEIALLDETIADLEYQKAVIQAKYDAREAAGTHIRPPTDAEVAAAEARASQTAELQETREGIVAAVAYARVAMEFQSEIQPEPSSA